MGPSAGNINLSSSSSPSKANKLTNDMQTHRMDRWTDGRMDGRTDGRMDGRTDGWMHGWMDGWMDGWMHGSHR
eukprot:2809960-Amphidinium_carterae.1